jgi:hypothetical protein
MFRWIFGLRSPRQKFEDGSQIRPRNRDEYDYSEPDGHLVTVEAAMTGVGPIDRVLRQQYVVRWKAPDDAEPISENKRREIIGKFRSYFDKRRITYRIE